MINDHPAAAVVAPITDLIHKNLLALKLEEHTPRPGADESGHFMGVLRERIKRLRQIRDEVEDLLSISTHPGY